MVVKKKKVILGDGNIDVPPPPPTTTRRLGIYDGAYQEDYLTTQFSFQPEIANTYYSPSGALGTTQKNNEITRIQKGISICMSIGTKGTQYIDAYANHTDPTVDTWIENQVDNAVQVANANPNVPVYITFEQEYEVKVNKAAITGASAVEATYGAALSRFFTYCKNKAPNLLYGYWYGGSDQAAILTVLQNITVNPQWISLDPYATPAHAATETLQQTWAPNLAWLRTGGASSQYVRLGSPPIGISEFGMSVEHGEAALVKYYTNIRQTMENSNVIFATFFNRNSGSHPYNITGEDTPTWPKFPNAIAAFTASYNAGGGTPPPPTAKQITGLSSVTPVSLGDPDASGVITEASGIATSWKNTGQHQFWTHNDQGTSPDIYMIDDQAGTSLLATVTLTGAGDATQFEDIAVGVGPDPTKSYVYVGRTGNGATQRSFYRVEEPLVPAGSGNLTFNLTPVTFNFTMPSGINDCEAFLVDPITGDLFWFQKKSMTTRPFTCNAYKCAGVAGMTTNQTVASTLVGAITANVESVNNAGFTAAAISKNGKYVALCNYQEIFIWNRPDTTQTLTQMFQAQPTAPVRIFMTTDAGASSTWGSEALDFTLESEPARMYGVAEGVASPLKYVTPVYTS
jgi:hypothetical protein